MITLQDLKSFLSTTTTGKKLLAEADAFEVAQRQAALDERNAQAERLAQMEKDLAVAGRKHFAAVEAADVDVTTARAAVESALARYSAAVNARTEEMETRTRERDELRRFLVRSAPAPLLDLVRGLQDLEQSLANLRPETVTRRVPNPTGTGMQSVVWSNAQRIADRLVSVRATIEEARALLAAPVADIDASIAQLWAQVDGPDVDTPMVQVS